MQKFIFRKITMYSNLEQIINSEYVRNPANVIVYYQYAERIYTKVVLHDEWQLADWMLPLLIQSRTGTAIDGWS